MTIKEFIEKAIEGGWKDRIQAPAPSMFKWSEKRLEEEYARICEQSVLLDHLAWQAVGKIEGWGERRKDVSIEQSGGTAWHTKKWKQRMHDMIGALAACY